MKRKKKNNNYTWIAAAIIILALAIYASGGIKITLPFSGVPTTGNFNNPDQVTDYAAYTNILSIDKSEVCRGQSVLLTINTNIANGQCVVFVNPNNAGWQYLTTVQLNSNGYYSTTQVVNIPVGVYTGRAVCGDGQGNFKVSNSVMLAVRDCGNDEDDGNDGNDDGTPCGWHTATYGNVCSGSCPEPNQVCRIATEGSESCACMVEAGQDSYQGNIFFSSLTWNGAMGNTMGADQKCANMAYYARLPGTWIALLSSTGYNIDARLPHHAYYKMDGTLVANSWADLLDGTILSPIDVDENGIKHSGMDGVWTGSSWFGQVQSDCHQWGWVSATGTAGNSKSIGTPWISELADECSKANHIYCVKLGDI